MNKEELTQYRIEQLENRYKLLEEWRQSTAAQVAKMSIILNEINGNMLDNRKTLKGIFVSVIAGVILLFITTIVAKLT